MSNLWYAKQKKWSKATSLTWLSEVVLLDGLQSISDILTSSILLSHLLGSLPNCTCFSLIINCNSSDLFRNISSVHNSKTFSSSGVASCSVLEDTEPYWPFIHCSKCMAPPLCPLFVLPICLHLCSINSSICFCASAPTETMADSGFWKMLSVIWFRGDRYVTLH